MTRSSPYKSRLAQATAELERVRQEYYAADTCATACHRTLERERKEHAKLSRWVAKQDCIGASVQTNFMDCGRCIPCKERK